MFDVTFMRLGPTPPRRAPPRGRSSRRIAHQPMRTCLSPNSLFFLLRLFISFTPPNPTGCRSKKYEATSEFDYRLTGSGSRNLHFRSSAEIQLPK